MKEKILKWYQREKTKDEIELDKDKKIFIQQIKSLKKEEIFKKEEEKKYSIWKKIKIAILGS